MKNTMQVVFDSGKAIWCPLRFFCTPNKWNRLPLRFMRYFLQLSYNGAGYCGWQVQPNGISVQQVLNEALQTLLGASAVCTGSGRTDTGVHARMQVAHFDADLHLAHEELLYKLNSILPKDIAVQSLKPVKNEAHARYDAMCRSYEYHIHRQKDPFREGFSYYFKPEVDTDAMNAAASLLLEWKDFQSFSKVKTDVKHYDCEVFEAVWKNQNDTLVFYVSANRFLRGMVRAMVGTLLQVGIKKLSIDGLRQILEKRDRRAAARNVPPEGLYLTKINYPEEIYILA